MGTGDVYTGIWNTTGEFREHFLFKKNDHSK